VVVLDNLREGVLTPDLYDPTLNPLYRDVLKHYGAVALPCRVNDPDRKGKVESGVGHARKTPLKGLRFETAEDAQAYLDRWEERWADTRIHGTTKRQVAAMFAEEKPLLLALPVEPFRYYQYGERTVHLDGCVEVEAAYYGAPPGWIGRRVQVQWDASRVRLLDPLTGNLLREHLRQQRGRHQIKDEDRPSKTPSSTRLLLARCEKAGQHIGAFCQGLHRNHGEAAVRLIVERLGREEVSCNSEVDDVFQVGRCKLKRLLYIIFVEFRILFEEIRTVRIERYRFDHPTHGHAHSTDARLSVHLLRVYGDAVETCCGHKAAFWIKCTNPTGKPVSCQPNV
jgi:hypothetical protein